MTDPLVQPMKPLTNTTMSLPKQLQESVFPRATACLLQWETALYPISEALPALPGVTQDTTLNQSMLFNSIHQTQVPTQGANSNMQEATSPKVHPSSGAPSASQSSTISTSPEAPESPGQLRPRSPSATYLASL
jgi:hypothetical protein